MSEKAQLILYPVPSLVSLLLNKEKGKGHPLTEAEVLEIRNACTTIAVPVDVAREMDEARGYQDIDPENAWEDWQIARVELIKGD